MINKAVIAAAGKGTRMLHLTKNKSKHIIRVNKKPFLAYLFDNLFRAGYNNLIVVVGYKAELVQEFIEKYKPPKERRGEYKIETVNQFKVLKKGEYGTASALKCVKQVVGKKDFLFVCGDNLYSVKDLKMMNISGKYNYVAGVYREHPEKYGVLITDNGFLKRIIEKPKRKVGNLTNIGLYKFRPEVFEKVSKIHKSPRGEYEITDVISLLAKEKKVRVKKIKDYWIDFGNPADIIKFSRFLKSSKNFK